MTQLLAIARLDLAALRRSRWLWCCVATYAVLAVVLITASSRESALLGFTGSSRVLLSFSHALLIALPLVALTATAPIIPRAREDGSLELLLSQPLAPSAWFAATYLVRLLALVVPLAAALIAVALYGQLAYGDPIPLAFIGRALAVASALIVTFAGLGALIAAYVRDPTRVITYLLLVWAAAVALVDFGVIGVLLRWHLAPRAVFAIAIGNPVEAARLALLGYLQPDLATYGPVGFYLATHLGANALFALGVIWPTAVGALAFAAALRKFRRSDRV